MGRATTGPGLQCLGAADLAAIFCNGRVVGQILWLERGDGQAAAQAGPAQTGDDQGLAGDIQDQVVEIFESCNFQDLTGQRITKVVGTMRFIEDRIIRMMDIWGGIESFQGVEVVDELHREGDAALLNGPALEGQADVASQDDIDALFA